MGVGVNSTTTTTQTTVGKDQQTAVVKTGETRLADVAKRLGVSEQTLRQANPSIKDFNHLKPGQEIRLTADPWAGGGQAGKPNDKGPMPSFGELAKAMAPGFTQTFNAVRNAAGTVANWIPKPDPWASTRPGTEGKIDAKLPPDEESVKKMAIMTGQKPDEILAHYRAMKQEFTDARQFYLQTGKVPPNLKYNAPIEIKTGTPMTRAQRYDAMLDKQANPGLTPENDDGIHNPPEQVVVGDVLADRRDPDYLTKEEFAAEFWSREKKEYQACEDDNIRPGTIDKCQRAVDEKYGGPEFIEWRNGQEAKMREAYQQYQQKVDGLTSSGPVSLAGRVVGTAIGGERGGDIGALIGGIGDMGVGIWAGVTARGRVDSYKGSAGLGASPAEVVETRPAEPAPEAETQPDRPPVELNSAGLPEQIFDAGVNAGIGPAYKTFEEARASLTPEQLAQKVPPHITENILYDKGGNEIARWWEVSESMSGKDVTGAGRLGDTEQKALLRVRLQPGMKLEIRGSYAPCTSVKGGCDMALQATAIRTGAEIEYRTLNGAVSHYPKDQFVEDAADGGEMRTLPPEMHTLTPEQESTALQVRKDAYDKAYTAALEKAEKTGSTQAGKAETKLSDIAKRLGVKTNALREANPGLKEPLKPGQTLKLPVKAVARAKAREAGDRALAEWLRAHVTGAH